jgi:TonB family C-terminal domain
MITYILETLAFQLVFLLTYDLFLKKETFFQWNRVYLLATFVLSLVLPWVKFEMLKTTMPQELGNVTIFLTQLDGVVLTPEGAETLFWSSLPWYYWLLIVGSLVSALWFVVKLIQIARLKRSGTIQQFPEYDKIIVQKSSLAFSFFRNIFLGAEIQKEKEANIIAHELVHVKQRHTLDLLFFELARIVFWFNPLTYVYQNRMAELHEFIADAQVVKDNKREHFEMLLSEAFKTQHISFINQFFNKSLIKKRIVMLQKKRSKAVWQLKYVLLLPMVLGMLVYTSCENDTNTDTNAQNQLSLEERLVNLNSEIEGKDSLTQNEREQIAKMAQTMIDRINNSAKEVNGWTVKAGIGNPPQAETGDEFIAVFDGKDGVESVPYALVDEVPIYPGCENAEDKSECFKEAIQNHIKKHFNYPQEAQKQGIQGKVSLLFHINGNGDVVDVKAKGPNPILENEAKRIVNRLPRMQPGKQAGKVADVVFSIPITFKLQ